MDRDYSVRLEIAGPAAMFTRPDSGASPVSYPAPTFSAVKAMFEAVARLRTAYIRPTRLEICAPIVFHRYVTNYGGTLRKRNQIRQGASYQLRATILVDVCYKVYGEVRSVGMPPNGINHLHALQAIFGRRLRKGQCYYTPCLGWREFVPSYFGPLRRETRVQEGINLTIPSMLYAVFDKPVEGSPDPEFRQAVAIRNGVLAYDQ